MCRKRAGCLAIGSLVFVLIVVALCGAVYWLAGPSMDCRRPDTGPARPGFSTRTLRSGGLERCYLLYVPDGHNSAEPAPLVLSLHGFASQPKGQRHISNWMPIADREGFLVVFPQGTGFPLRWNSFSALGSTVDDVQFVRDLLADVSHLVAVEPTRIYASGMSNGGAMSHRLACDLADTIAAAGIVAGPATNPPDACTPSRPVPIVAFFGTADPLVSYAGGQLAAGPWSGPMSRFMGTDLARFELLGAGAWAAGWAKRNGCTPNPDPVAARGDASGVRYGACGGGAEVLFYTIDGGGHTWPGGPDIPLLGKTSHDISASETMWQFFEAHPLD